VRFWRQAGTLPIFQAMHMQCSVNGLASGGLLAEADNSLKILRGNVDCNQQVKRR